MKTLSILILFFSAFSIQSSEGFPAYLRPAFIADDGKFIPSQIITDPNYFLDIYGAVAAPNLTVRFLCEPKPQRYYLVFKTPVFVPSPSTKTAPKARRMKVSSNGRWIRGCRRCWRSDARKKAEAGRRSIG